MNEARAKKLLNWSLVCIVLYYALFFIGWSLQMPLFAGLFEYTDEQISNMVTVFFPSVVIVLAVGAVGLTVFNILLRMKFSSRVFICAAVFFVLTFISDRVAKVAIPYAGVAPHIHPVELGEPPIVLLNVIDTWHSGELSKNTIMALDTFLSVFLAAAIVLMCCAACIKGKLRDAQDDSESAANLNQSEVRS